MGGIAEVFAAGILGFYYHEKVTKPKSEDLGFNLTEGVLGQVTEPQFLPFAKWELIKPHSSPRLWTGESIKEGHV